MNLRLLLALALLLPLAAAPARAQEDDAAEDAVIVLDELVAEAEALPEPEPAQPAEDAPVEVRLEPALERVIEREVLERRGAEGLDRVLEAEPGFIVQETFAGSTVSYQGLPGKFSAVTIDGQRLPGHIFETIDFGQLATGAVGSVEVIRGPQAAALGPHSAGVVVNLLPRRADRALGELTVGAGSFGYNRQHLYVLDGGPRGGVSLSAERTQRDAYDLNALFPDTDGDGFERTNVALDYRRVFTDQQWCGPARCADDPAALLPGDEFHLHLERFSEDASGRGFSPPDLVRHLDSSTTRTMAAADYTWRLGRRESLKLSHNYAGYDHGIERYFPGFPDTLQASGFSETLHDTRLGWEHDGAQRWQAGLEHGAETLESDRIARGSADATQSAAYVVWSSEGAETCCPSDVRLDAALRLDQHSEFGSTLSPKFGATWRLDDASTLELGAGLGYRAPSLRERNYEFASPFGYTVVGNAELQPETSYSLTADYLRSGPRGHFALGVFRHRVRELIVFSEIQAVPQVFQTENVGTALSSGLQLGWERRWPAAGCSEIGVGYDGVWLAQSRDGELGSRLPNAPVLDHRLRVFWERDDWGAEALWRSIGSYYLDRENTSLAPGYGLLNLSVSRSFGDSKLRLSALNALDTTDARFGPEPGRELRAEWTIGF